jgi:uncharacterized membrane protein
MSLVAHIAALLTIIAAALALAATKLASFALLARHRPAGFLKACLDCTPGTMITALIVPDLVSMGRVGLAAAVAAGVVALASRNMVATVVAGALCAAGLRALAGAGFA